jgi:tetratricopeptide (TPR) repeat protein
VLLDEMKWDELSEYERGMVANNRAYFNLKLGNNDEAISSDLEIAFENLGPKIELLDTRAMALIEKNQFDAAVRDLSQATIYEPSSGRYHFHLALAHQGRDDRVAAREALQLAQAIGLSQKVMEPSEKSKYETLQSWLEN